MEELLHHFEENYTPVLKSSNTQIFSSFFGKNNSVKHILVQNDCHPYYQGKSGYCWLVSALQCISIYAKKFLGISLFFDAEYLVFFDKMEKAKIFFSLIRENAHESLESPLNSFILRNAMTDRGQWEMAKSLIKKYGLVPVEKGKNNHKKNTREMNVCLSYLMRVYAYKIRCAKNANESLLEINKIENEALQKIYNILVDIYGKPARLIDLGNGTAMTPKEYFDTVVQFPFEKYISIFAQNNKENKQYEIEYDGYAAKGFNNSFLCIGEYDFNNIIERQIRSEGFCWCTGDAGKYYIKNKCVFDDSAFDLSSLIDPIFNISKTDIFQYHIASMSHAMVLFDVRSDNKNKVFMVYDSAYSAEEGKVCSMSSSWFEKYLFQGIVRVDLLPKDCVSKIKCVRVEPWRFFGA